MYTYAYLEQISAQIVQDSINNEPTATDDLTIMQLARQATRTIEHSLQMWFVPDYRTVSLPCYPNSSVNLTNNTLRLPYDCVEIESITVAGTALSSSDYRFWKIGSPYPHRAIYRLRNGASWFDGTDSDSLFAITGTYCYKTRYEDTGWIDSSDSVQDGGGINASVTTITVSDVDGGNAYGLSPRFDIGMIIRIDSEYCIVTGLDTATNTLTVVRGARGTTATSHDNAATIDTFNVEHDINRACQLITAFNYSNIGNTNRVSFDGTVIQGLQIPPEAVSILSTYRNRSIIQARGF